MKRKKNLNIGEVKLNPKMVWKDIRPIWKNELGGWLQKIRD